jgi:tRNA C32,U32 (ribose-2'-O)-methylase TrmJ
MSNEKNPPSSSLHIALIEPEIPPNTGNIARLCLATYTTLHLVGKLGFRTDDKAVQRAGLDYWHEVEIRYHHDLAALYEALPECRFLYFTTKVRRAYTRLAGRVVKSKCRTLPDDPDAESARAVAQSGDLGRHRTVRSAQTDRLSITGTGKWTGLTR